MIDRNIEVVHDLRGFLPALDARWVDFAVLTVLSPAAKSLHQLALIFQLHQVLDEHVIKAVCAQLIQFRVSSALLLYHLSHIDLTELLEEARVLLTGCA